MTEGRTPEPRAPDSPEPTLHANHEGGTEHRDVAGGVPEEYTPTTHQRTIGWIILAAAVLATLLLYFGFFRPRISERPSHDHGDSASGDEGTAAASGHEGHGAGGMGAGDGFPVEVTAVSLGDVSEYVTYSGTVLPLSEEVVYPRVTGWVRSINVDEGDTVHAGDVVVRLDETELRARAEAARAGYNEAVEAAHAMAAAVDEVEAKLREDEAALRRARAQVDEDEGRVFEREAGVAAAKAAQTAAEAAVRRAAATEREHEARASQAGAAKEEADSQLERHRADLRQARSDRTQADATRASAQAKLDYWKREFQREDKLYEVGAISEEEHDRARESLRVAEERVRETEAALTSADERIAAAEAGAAAAEARSRRAADEIKAAREALEAAKAAKEVAQADLDRASADVDAANATLSQARAKLRQSRERVGEVQSLIDQDEARILMARAEKRKAQAGVTGAHQRYRAEHSVQEYTRVRAETSGTVSRRLVDTGTLVSPGMPLLRIASMNAVRVQVKVSERHLAGIDQHAPVRIRTSEGAAIEDARVRTVFPEEDPETKTGIVEIILDNPGGRLKLNSYVTCEIATVQRESVVMVDSRALFEVEGQVHVYKVVGGVAHRTKVTLGTRSGEHAEVLDGLEVGDEVVVVGLKSVRDGAKVSPRRGPAELPAVSEDQMEPGEPRMRTPPMPTHDEHGDSGGTMSHDEGSSH